MTLGALPGDGKIGVATAKSLGCHARRNKEKRRAVAALRNIGEQAWQGMDVVVTVKPAIYGAKANEIEEELKNLVTELRSRWANGSASD